MTEITLMPCPFCGEKSPRLEIESHFNFKELSEFTVWTITCENGDCYIKMEKRYGQGCESLVASWNERAKLNE